ncbi:glycoside hydrolase family 5 protein [Sphingomonas sp. BAUL-RG-20F-R05-02]|uniref:glycoside hydrolase family 5 protein n=1 Tax=Sphingomonas sp. BAUL-RG-20F-R05-02 TaxID=2914830 RepID=UPI001F5AA0B3|nr:glycoside hydrolase family 5 protein [Sphingomonas sp. BAUL-RG-20F-R05-02]
MKITGHLTSTSFVAIGIVTAALAAVAATTSSPTTQITSTSTPVMVVSAPAASFATSTTATGTMSSAASSTKPSVPTATMPNVAPTRGPIAGVNLSGGEFGTVPGKIFFQYVYPTNAEIDYFYANGFRLLRIPFRWERLQPNLYGPLSATDRAALKAATNYATSKGMTVVLDMHDFAARRATPDANVSTLVGANGISEKALANAWTQIASDYKDNPKVWLGLMNEPSHIDTAVWWEVVQSLVNDLRTQHITNKFMVPGASWTGAWSWISSGNAGFAERFTDPNNNFAFEVHQYLDKDSSGTNAACVAGAANRIDAVISWAKTKKVQLFFGEMAGSGDNQCQIEYPAMLKKLNADNIVIGWTAWGGGKWWNASYPFRLAPVSGSSPTPHMTLLLSNMQH